MLNMGLLTNRRGSEDGGRGPNFRQDSANHMAISSLRFWRIPFTVDSLPDEPLSHTALALTQDTVKCHNDMLR